MDRGDVPARIAKAPTHIIGFDEITNGGIPRGRTTLVIGGPGSGKTIFALQTLVNGASNLGEPGIFVAFEERSKSIIANASTFGWNIPDLVDKKLFFLDARMDHDVVASGNFDLLGLLTSIKAKADEMGAKRIVFDSIDVLLNLFNDPLIERKELYRIYDWFCQTGLTGLLTVRIEVDSLVDQRYGFLQFMADYVVLLHHRLVDRMSTRGLRVLKYRGSSFAENESPLVIGPRGIEISCIRMSEIEYQVSTERVSTGIVRLDSMLNGGYFRGSSVLVTGMPGTAKSTLCGSFINESIRRGESALYVSFDESSNEMVRNLSSVNICLEPYIRSGLLRMYSARTESRSAEEHLMNMRRLIEEHRPKCMVVDPLSALVKSGGQASALAVSQKLIHLAKTRGITLVCSSLLSGGETGIENSEIKVSTIADTWIHLSYVVQGGERNRALTIVKSRGMEHSNQVRELILTDNGVTLTDVYTAGGEVLMGSLRWEKEESEKRENSRIKAQIEQKQRDLELAEAEIISTIDGLSKDLENNRVERIRLAEEERERNASLIKRRTELQELRSADSNSKSNKDGTED